MFLSDNGKTFKTAAKFIETVFKDTAVREHLASHGVQWRFNVEKAVYIHLALTDDGSHVSTDWWVCGSRRSRMLISSLVELTINIPTGLVQ